MAILVEQKTESTAAEREAILAKCDRFVNGHGRMIPRQALAELVEAAGDDPTDVYGAGAVIEALEREVAALLGQEAAVFLPSGTMAQPIALRLWADRKHCRTVAFHPTCHLEIHEQFAYQAVHGLRARLIGQRHRLPTLDDLKSIKESVAALLLELPAREIGGQLPSWDDLVAQTNWARERGVALHMDGARLWEAGPFYDRPYAEIGGLFDSVYVSFYKGIGAISGAALAGPADFVAEAKIWQHRQGGRVLHLFPYVLSARENLKKRLDRFPAYTQRAKSVAATLATLPGVVIKPSPPQTRLFHVCLPGDADVLTRRGLEIAERERIALFNRINPTEVPGYSVIEMNIGDAAEAFTDAEIAALYQRLIEPAN